MPQWKILIIDDNPDDRAACRRLLQGPKTERAVLDRLRRDLTEGRLFHGETINYRKDGSDFALEWRVAPLRNAEGRVTHFVATQHDITARKQADVALRESEGKFATAFQLNPLLMAVVTTEGRYVEVNATFEHSTGYTRAELLGQTSAELGFYVEIHQRELIFDILHREGRLQELEMTWLTKTGERRTYLLSADPITLQGQQHLLAVSIDITARTQTREERERLLAELQRVNAELQQFAYIVSHDLNEPLRTISNFVTLLARRHQGNLDAEASEYIAFAVDGAQRMQQMLQDLLVYTQAGQKPEFATVDCEALLTRVVEAVQLRIAECEAVITRDPLPTVPGDATRLGQVFQNLISNALKFRGAAPPRIHVSAQREGGSWRFAVRDNGIGIDPAQADCIFQVFQRLHTRSEYSGTGIGLSICKKIVEQHGGRIWVESTPGQGSTFLFTIQDRR